MKKVRNDYYNSLLKSILFTKSKHYVMKSNLLPPYGNIDSVITKNDLVNRIFRKYSIYSGNLKASYYNRYQNIRNYLLSLYKHINYDSVYANKSNHSNFNALLVKELLYRMYYTIDYDPICRCCKNKVSFSGERMWKTYCSKECQNKDVGNIIKIGIYKKYNSNEEYERRRIEQCRKTYKERYGVSWYNNRDKMKQTKLKNWGCTNWVNPNKAINTKISKYGSLSYIGLKAKQTFLANHQEGYSYILNKVKETCNRKYGCDWTTQTYIMKEKSKQTKLDRYNNPYYNNPNKVLDTVLKKYNCSYIFQSEEIKQQIRQTCLEKYGSTYWNQSEYGKEIISYIMSLPGTQAKINDTKCKNHTFNTSKPEDECYHILVQHFNKEDIIRQHKSDTYPFQCDFYIKSIDSYIECNFHWTHNNHLYNKNNIKDIITKCKWNIKSKKSKFYANALKTWTVRDVNKFNIAKKNNLNYLVFYSLNEFIKYFK